MDKRKEIVEKYEEFQSYLNSIQIDNLKNQYSRKELNDLKNTIENISLRSTPYELSKVIQKMKEEEYPELLGVHHFSIIKEINFLSEKEKIKLDNYLAKLKVGQFVYGLNGIFYSRKKYNISRIG